MASMDICSYCGFCIIYKKKGVNTMQINFGTGFITPEQIKEQRL